MSQRPRDTCVTANFIENLQDFFELELDHLYMTIKTLRKIKNSVQFSSVAQSCLTLCDPRDSSTPGLPVHHQLPELAQTHVH